MINKHHRLELYSFASKLDFFLLICPGDAYAYSHPYSRHHPATVYIITISRAHNFIRASEYLGR